MTRLTSAILYDIKIQEKPLTIYSKTVKLFVIHQERQLDIFINKSQKLIQYTWIRVLLHLKETFLQLYDLEERLSVWY